jgi:hypothetical protein
VFDIVCEQLLAPESTIKTISQKIQDKLVITEQNEKEAVKRQSGALHGDIGMLYTIVKALGYL